MCWGINVRKMLNKESVPTVNNEPQIDPNKRKAGFRSKYLHNWHVLLLKRQKDYLYIAQLRNGMKIKSNCRFLAHVF